MAGRLSAPRVHLPSTALGLTRPSPARSWRSARRNRGAGGAEQCAVRCQRRYPLHDRPLDRQGGRAPRDDRRCLQRALSQREVLLQAYSWETVGDGNRCLAGRGAHDIYYFGEGGYLARAEQENGFEDITARINDPAWAEEKAKYLYWDRIEAYRPKLIGLPICWHVEDALFVNMDMVSAAGFDETFVEDWDTFVECVTEMTRVRRPTASASACSRRLWRVVSARPRRGGRYLNADLSAPAINTPDVVLATQQLVDFFAQGSRRRRAPLTTTRRRMPSSLAGWRPIPLT